MENGKGYNIGLIGTMVGATIMTIGMFGGYIVGITVESSKIMHIGLVIFYVGTGILIGGLALVTFYLMKLQRASRGWEG